MAARDLIRSTKRRTRELAAPRRTPRADAEFVDGVAGADLRGPGRFAHLLLGVLVTFLVVFLAWASWAALEEVTRGEGRVIPSSEVQLVQNLEGGIVRELLVHEGEIVDAGQVLLRIDDTTAASTFREARARYLSLLAQSARLRAEIDETAVNFPPEVLNEARDAAENEQALFNARQDDLQTQIEILRSQARQREQELTELHSQQEQLERSYELAREELRITEPLAQRRIVPQVEYLRLQRQVNELRGNLEQTKLAVPRVEEALAEAHRRIEEQLLSFRSEALRERNAVEAELSAMREAITAEEDRVSRTEVRSPVRGAIKDMHVTTVGQVVQPGQDLVEIVPLDDTLLVEAQVRPADIAFVRPGLPATVKVTAYDFSIYGGLDGEVVDISADTIVNEQGEAFYRMRVRTADNELGTAASPLPIIPGMTVQVDVLTGEKTVLDYLLKPILKAQQNALRER